MKFAIELLSAAAASPQINLSATATTTLKSMNTLMEPDKQRRCACYFCFPGHTEKRRHLDSDNCSTLLIVRKELLCLLTRSSRGLWRRTLNIDLD